MSAPNCWWRSRSPTKSRTLLPRQCCTGESSLSSPVNNYWKSCKELYGERGRLVLSKRQIHAIVFARDSPEPPHPIANNWYTYKPTTTMRQDAYSIFGQRVAAWRSCNAIRFRDERCIYWASAVSPRRAGCYNL